MFGCGQVCVSFTVQGIEFGYRHLDGVFIQDGGVLGVQVLGAFFIQERSFIVQDIT